MTGGRVAAAAVGLVVAAALVVGAAAYSYQAGARSSARACTEAVAAARIGFATVDELVGMLELKMALAQEMLHAVNDRDQRRIDELQGEIDRLDRAMEANAVEVHEAQDRLDRHAAACG